MTAAALSLAALAGCQFGTTASPTTGAAAGGAAAASGGAIPVGDSAAPMPAPHSCVLGSQDGQPLPDPHCTPGATNPAVTQANIRSTICSSGWTKTVRPPTSLTDRMKKQSDQSYGLATSASGEYDHLISLELGGAPSDPRNLWVEPGKIPNPKDAVENKLNDAVCTGLVPLATAQQAIAHDWVTAIDDAGLAVAGGKLCLRAEPTRCATG